MLEQIQESLQNNYARVSGRDRKTIDPLTIMLLMSLLLEAFKMIQECKKTRHPQDICQRPSMADRFKLRRLIREHNTEKKTGFQFAHRLLIEKALLEEGKNIDDGKFKTITEEISKASS
jgi:hypothetical protein